ncbi:efflux transporter outer membrane subunit [Sphingomonas sp.]|uniref:efflux transporter outer membrane subunit n=1 Tax=Sphingomonas sp. TaxID=28214 RepID=UPI003AFFB3EF
MRKAEAALLSGLLALAGCDLAPRYAAPPIAVPSSWKEVPAGWQAAEPSAATLPPSWWGAFGDPVLNDLEARVEAANPSLAASLARYDAALGELGVSRADLFPTVTIGGNAERTRTSGNTLSVAGGRAYDLYAVQGSLAYEIDLFGRVRNQIRSSRGEVEASAADVRGVRLGLQAQLASTYFQLRGADARLKLLGETVQAFDRAYQLTVTRHEGGIASGLDTNRARTQLSAARAEIAATQAQRATYEHAIAALAGTAPAGFALPPIAGDVPTPPVVPAGLPSTLLERRPDVDAAERRAYAANRDIGVARAALFPALTLGADGGFQSTGARLISAASSFWALGPASAALTILDGGARRSRVRIARARFDEAAANYKQTVLTALREVEDDLAQSRDQARQERDLADAAQAADRTNALALIRYRDGASDFLEVVTAQTAALDTRRSLIELRTQRLATAVDTVRALGGPVA